MLTKILNKFGLYTRKQIEDRLNQSLEYHDQEKFSVSKYTEIYHFGGYSAVLAIRVDLLGY